MLEISEEKIKAQAEKACIMINKNDRACYVAGYLGGYNAAETERQEYEKKLLQENQDQQNKIALLSQKVNVLQKAYDKQKKINKDLVDENEELEKKREQDCDSSWYEGFNCSEKERLKQIIKAKEIIKELLDFDFLPDIEIKKQAEQFLKDQEE